jgi:hypothetical protein
MLHVGEHLYGVVDQVPGVLHVATRILHFNFLPIVPLGSVVSVDKRVAGEAIHVKTRFSLKSVAFAYLRLTLMCGAVGLGLISILMWDMEQMQPNPPPWFQSLTLGTMGVGLVTIFVWWWTHRLTHARYSRAIELADAVGMDREIIDENFRSRGLTPSEDAAPTMATVPDRWANDEKDDVYRLE